MRFCASLAHREVAVRHLAYGVSSTPRAGQLPAPIVAEQAEGAWITDADGNRFIDYALGYGPLILGHSPAPVLEAVRAELARGLRTASVHRGEAQLAELVAACMPAAEVSAFVSTGTEAVQLAVRVARAATGRMRVVRFRANYHGWFDNVHTDGAPGREGPDAVGQDPHAADSFTVLGWGDADALDAVDATVAAVLLEPVAINPGCFRPPPGYLEQVRAVCDRHGALLIFDEVITGFRLGLGGAQERYGVYPDLSVLGKALGAGSPSRPCRAGAGPWSLWRAAGCSIVEPITGTPFAWQRRWPACKCCRRRRRRCIRGWRGSRRSWRDIWAARRGGWGCWPARSKPARCCRYLLAWRSCRASRLWAPSIGRGPGGSRRDCCGVASQAIPRGVMYLSAAHGEAEIDATVGAITGALEEMGTLA